MRDKTKQTKIQPHVFKKNDRCRTFIVWYCFNIAHAQNSQCSRSCSVIMDLQKRSVFVDTYKTVLYCYFFISLYFIVIFFFHTFIYLDFNLYTLLLCVLYKRYPYSMCTQSKEAQSCNIMQIYWAFLNKTF